MKIKHAHEIADEQLQRLALSLGAGKSEALSSYLSAMSKFHRYSLKNQLLIYSQMPEASYVAGFRRWHSFRRRVKKGAKGITIIIPFATRKKDYETGTEKTLMSFKAGYVFDISQTEGQDLPLPPAVRGEPGDCLSRLKDFLTSRNIQLEYSNMYGGAEGLSRGGLITIQPGLEKAREFVVLVHEVAHELLHQTAEGKKRAKSIRETEAEAVAFIVSEAIGLSCGSACSDYIQLYGGDTSVLKQSLLRIRNVSSEILAFILPADTPPPSEQLRSVF